MERVEKRFDFKMSPEEYELLDKYCKEVMRNKGDVLRELIRGLKPKNL
jgi:predicted DNA-binding protein